VSNGYVGLTLFKLNMRNVANSITSFLTNTNTAARTYTFQDRDGTIADNTDLALKANLESPTFTGTVTVPTPTTGTQASNKDYSDSLNPDFYQYSIVRSVGNLVVNNSFETDLSGWS